MSNEETPVPGASQAGSLAPGLLQRKDGVFFDLSLAPEQLRSAVDQLFQSGMLLAGIDYPLFLMTLYHAPAPRMGSSSPRNRERISPCLALISSARLATS